MSKVTFFCAWNIVWSVFLQAGMNLRKVNRHVDFPLILDLAPFCSATCKVQITVINISQYQWFKISHNSSMLLIFLSCAWQNLGSGERVLYSLYGIVEHSGSMRGGHYTAYVKVRTPPRRTEQRRNQSGTTLLPTGVSIKSSIYFLDGFHWKAWITCWYTKYSFHPTIGLLVYTALKMWLFRWRSGVIVQCCCIGAFLSRLKEKLRFQPQKVECKAQRQSWENRFCLLVVNHCRIYCCKAIGRLRAK